jgi:hypothetical protein
MVKYLMRTPAEFEKRPEKNKDMQKERVAICPITQK